MMRAIRKAFDLMGDDKAELSTGKESFKIKVGSYDDDGS